MKEKLAKALTSWPGLQRFIQIPHGTVRTVTVGMRGKDDGSLSYVPRPLQELKLGVQRIAVIFPVEEQQEDEQTNASDSDSVAWGQGPTESDRQ